MTLFEELRAARLASGLSQGALAGRLGLHQRQISDLERAAMDPRLSTLQDVARGLELDLMLVPRALIPVVEGLLHGRAGAPDEQPLYALDRSGEDQEEAPARAELGAESRVRANGALSRRSRRSR